MNQNIVDVREMEASYDRRIYAMFSKLFSLENAKNMIYVVVNKEDGVDVGVFIGFTHAYFKYFTENRHGKNDEIPFDPNTVYYIPNTHIFSFYTHLDPDGLKIDLKIIINTMTFNIRCVELDRDNLYKIENFTIEKDGMLVSIISINGNKKSQFGKYDRKTNKHFHENIYYRHESDPYRPVYYENVPYRYSTFISTSSYGVSTFSSSATISGVTISDEGMRRLLRLDEEVDRIDRNLRNEDLQ